VVEASGIPTAVLSVNRGYSERVKAPRTGLLRFPYGSVFGRPGDTAGQREVLMAVLGLLETVTVPGTIVELPFRWRRKGH
jgi:D-proline reductase (dithiol) PrdB